MVRMVDTTQNRIHTISGPLKRDHPKVMRKPTYQITGTVMTVPAVMPISLSGWFVMGKQATRAAK